jgi:hypothetical protein
MTTTIEINCETNEVTERPLTTDELAAYATMQAQAEADRLTREAEAEAIATAKASAEAKLAALGLTPEEISALTK